MKVKTAATRTLSMSMLPEMLLVAAAAQSLSDRVSVRVSPTSTGARSVSMKQVPSLDTISGLSPPVFVMKLSRSQLKPSMAVRFIS